MSFFSIDNEIKRRQVELAEREQRLQNDPSRIFLNSLSRTAPQALLGALGDVGVNMATNYAKYNWFGGKEAEKRLSNQQAAQERYWRSEEAKTNPLSYQQFLRDYNLLGPASDQPSKQPSTTPAFSGIKKTPQQATALNQEGSIAQPRPQEITTLPDGRLATEIPKAEVKEGNRPDVLLNNKYYKIYTPTEDLDEILGDRQGLPKPDSLIKEEPPVVTPQQNLAKTRVPSYLEEEIKKEEKRWGAGKNIPTEANKQAFERAASRAEAGKAKRESVVESATKGFTEFADHAYQRSAETNKEKLDKMADGISKKISSLPPQEQAEAQESISLAANTYLPTPDRIAFEKKAFKDQRGIRDISSGKRPINVGISLKDQRKNHADNAKALYKKSQLQKTLAKTTTDERKRNQLLKDSELTLKESMRQAELSKGLATFAVDSQGNPYLMQGDLPKGQTKIAQDYQEFSANPEAYARNMANKIPSPEKRKDVIQTINNVPNNEWVEDETAAYWDIVKTAQRLIGGYSEPYKDKPAYFSLSPEQKKIIDKEFKPYTPEARVELMNMLSSGNYGIELGDSEKVTLEKVKLVKKNHKSTN